MTDYFSIYTLNKILDFFFILNDCKLLMKRTKNLKENEFHSFKIRAPRYDGTKKTTFWTKKQFIFLNFLEFSVRFATL